MKVVAKNKGMFLKVLVLEGFLVVPKKNVFVVAVPNPKQKTNNVFTHELKFGSAWACLFFWETACITSGLCIIPGLIKKTYPCTAMHMYIQVLKKVFWQPALPAWAMPLAGRAMPDWVVGCKLGSRI